MSHDDFPGNSDVQGFITNVDVLLVLGCEFKS